MLRALRISVLLAIAGACASLVKQPVVSLAEIQVASLGLSGATVEVTLDVTNPNSFDLDARAVEYTLFYLPAVDRAAAGSDEDWRTLAAGRTAEPVTLPGNGVVQVPVAIPFTFRELGEAAGSLLRDGTLRYRFQGAFTVGSPVGELRIPFDRTGVLDP
ncbi:MAG: LEA type 2 family protein [Gemmatimonadota bacterium]|jgi:LEA14-like dessication related protein